MAPRQQTMTAQDRRATCLHELRPQVLAWRRHLHSHPELSFQEHQTALYIKAALGEMGLQPTSPTATSVVADLDGARPGRTIAIRADIDALPIQEDTGLPFASQTPGVMHACGHDSHAATLLGVAAALSATREDLAGRIRLIFQHAEERAPNGAPQLIDVGVLDGVDMIIGQHVLPALPVGVIGVSPDLLLASCDIFEIELTGRGGHGAMPHESRDPLAAAAELVQAINRLIAREVDPRQTAVASITRIRAGDALNVIPSKAELGGTLRAFDRSVRDQLRARVPELAAQVAAANRMEAHVNFVVGLPALVNTAAIVEVIERAARRCDADLVLQRLDPISGSEDFACYLEHVPGAYMFTGAMPAGVDEPFPHHHPCFDIHEDAMAHATAILTEAAMTLADPATVIELGTT
jgi:amidohydrolase